MRYPTIVNAKRFVSRLEKENKLNKKNENCLLNLYALFTDFWKASIKQRKYKQIIMECIKRINSEIDGFI